MTKAGEIIKIKDNVFMNFDSGEKIKVGGLKAKVVWATPSFLRVRFLDEKIYDLDEEGNIKRDFWFSKKMIENDFEKRL